jgi:hypothetical protein
LLVMAASCLQYDGQYIRTTKEPQR